MQGHPSRHAHTEVTGCARLVLSFIILSNRMPAVCSLQHQIMGIRRCSRRPGRSGAVQRGVLQGATRQETEGHLFELLGVRARVVCDGVPLRPGALHGEQPRAGRRQLIRTRARHRRQQRHLRLQLVPAAF